MNRFVQYIPHFVEVDKRPEVEEFETTNGLLRLGIVQRWAETPDFSHFALSGDCLMAVFDGGFSWRVIGRVQDPASVELPPWDGGRYLAQLKSGACVILTNKEVVSSCGDALTLRDGSTAKNMRR